MKKVIAVVAVALAIAGAFFFGKYNEKQNLTVRAKEWIAARYEAASTVVTGLFKKSDKPAEPAASA